jgi:hypothetical protein
MPIFFSETSTPSQPNAQPFPAVKPRRALGDRAGCSPIKCGASSAQANYGERSNQAAFADKFRRTEMGTIIMRKKDDALAVEERKERRLREVKRIRVKAVAGESKNQAGRAAVLQKRLKIFPDLLDLNTKNESHILTTFNSPNMQLLYTRTSPPGKPYAQIVIDLNELERQSFHLTIIQDSQRALETNQDFHGKNWKRKIDSWSIPLTERTTFATKYAGKQKENGLQKYEYQHIAHRTFRPTDPKQASHSSSFAASLRASDGADHHFDPTSENAVEHVSGTTSNSDLESSSKQESVESVSDNALASSGDADFCPTGEEESYTPLVYQIPDDQMKVAMHASPSTPAAFWSHKLYRGPSDVKVTVHYCRSKETSETVAKLFLGKPVLGFDIEWKPQAKAESGLKNNISLVQLACEDRVGLFHLSLHRGETSDDILPPTLRAIIASPQVLKVGVAILADFSRVTKFLGIPPAGLIELSHMHRLVTYSEFQPKLVNKRLVSLAEQVQIHLHLPLSKGDVRTSDWSKELNHEQCTYAAADAYASYRVYEALEEKRIAMHPRPPRPEFAELRLPIKLADRLVQSDPESDEESVQTINEADSLGGELEKLSLGTSSSPLGESEDAVDHSLTDEELLKLESAADDVEVEDFSQEVTVDQPRFNDLIFDVRYPDQSLFEDDDIPVPSTAVLSGQACLTDTATLSVFKKSSGKQQATTVFSAGKQDLLDAANAWVETQPTLHPQSPPAKTSIPYGGKSMNRASLRCYYLWEHCNLDLDEIKVIVRDRPLKKATVASYIAEAVGYGNLVYSDVGRMKEVLNELPMAAWGRYIKLRKQVFEGKTEKGKEKLNDTEGEEWVV